MLKKAVLIALLCLGLLAWFAYQKWPITNPQTSINNASNEAKDICYFYKYDKENPGVHSQYGVSYHIEQWQKFTKKSGSTGAKNIDEFCEQLGK